MRKYFVCMIALLVPILTQATEFNTMSEFDIAQSKIKYSLLATDISSEKFQDADEITYKAGKSVISSDSYKSPGKAFAMSLLLPGLGQHYNGSSKLKTFAFVGVEITSWVLYFKWDKDADRLTKEFEDFNDLNWIESRYDTLLLFTYPPREEPYTEISHTLPESKTQQYYEMTGKYTQFAWGWKDAYLLSNGDTLRYDNYSINDPFPRVLGDNVPESPLRDEYEEMRDKSNNKYDQARKMVYVSMLNRLFSAFDAMIVAKKKNKNSGNSSGFSSVSAEASFKSLYVKRDTPYLTLSYKF